MKLRIYVCLVILAVAFSVSAQVANKGISSAPREFRMFYSSFKRAVERGNKTQAAGMVRFPFKYAFDAGDEGTMSKAQFLKEFDNIFSAAVFENITFDRGDDGAYIVSNDSASHLNFKKIRGKFKLTGYYAEP